MGSIANENKDSHSQNYNKDKEFTDNAIKSV